MRRSEVELRSDGNDTGWIHLSLAAVVVPLDLLDADGLRNARDLIEIAHIVRQIREFIDVPPVALEVRVIDGIEAYQSAKQPPVGFRDRVSNKVAVLRQDLFELIERIEDGIAYVELWSNIERELEKLS